MSPHLTEIEKIEQLLEQENFDLNNFSIEKKQDILLQKQLIEELTNLQILEELEEIHNQRNIKNNPFKRYIYIFSALLFLFSLMGIYFVSDFSFNQKNEINSENSIQNEINSYKNNEIVQNKNLENSIPQNTKSGLSWNKNYLIDTLKKSLDNLMDLKKAKIKRIHIIDTANRNKKNRMYHCTISTSIQSNEIIVCTNNSIFYLQSVSHNFIDSLYDVWYRQNPNYKYNRVTFYGELDYHIKKEEIKIVNLDGKNIISSPSLSADGNTLYYSKKSKKGDYDIWKTERILQNGKMTWQEPTEVKALNQLKSYELSPSISADGNTIYFSRNPNATGCARIYFSTKNEFGEWNKPQMISISDNKHINYGCDGAPYILPDGKTLLFSAQRTGKGVKNLGLYDIYMIQKQENNKWSEMELIESISSESTESHFTVLPKENKIYFSRMPPNGGYYFQSGHSIPIPKQLQAFFPQKEDSKLITQKNKLFETSTGKDFELNNFTFASNSALLTQKGKENLERILLFMNENPAVSLQIIAHTDNEGEINYNQILSEKRAKAVCQFLIEKGIDIKRLVPIGKGENQPKVENTNTENKAKNRRVEFFVTDEIK
ncbi:outer membrane protein/peptidoglycan-associated (lipo)protein [Bernardetia litoralis DSM 6794]|uniref:Outer membrane protein/peptidoglycan-associated (Lipo)protein n=1 Tax=Bernardetia litoralis (strain ATCC 23117 / DSM 6794 / NBRC 15988 / NCIMB 1366 / Fx l1 / Sio-4) TaxID=880071 RepID=I4AF34_BERLS|nr:OmpA family protein [Bernardetia litoralis]AFM02569.1 outer membrane protein/peptidoglycan-associated (lipo)protein [Bernardetia litoralis DSM 6794]